MKRIALVISLAVLLVGFTATLITVDTQSQTKNAPQQQNPEPDIPVVDINSQSFRNDENKDLRTNRGQKYNTGFPIKDVAKPPVEILELPLSHASVKPALPISQSDAILIGLVTESQAFLSSDKSYVYSEFTVQIEDVLKNFSPAALAPNITTTVERSGGIVRFSSGKTQRLGNGGEGLPQKQKRYLFFLKWSDAGKDFITLTGYELSNGKVIPLDGATDLSVYKNYRKYTNEDESKFLQTVKSFIDNPVEEVPASAAR